MTNKELWNAVKECVEDLDKDIISKLRENNIKGKVGQPVFCPVNKYLDKMLPGNEFWTDTNEVSVWYPVTASRYAREDYINIGLPENVQDFIHKFDRREYEEFIDDNH